VNTVGIRAIPPLVRLDASIDIVELKAPTNLQPLTPHNCNQHLCISISHDDVLKLVFGVAGTRTRTRHLHLRLS